MAYKLKTPDGKDITRPITHPATDEQVLAQLRRMNGAGELILPTEDFAPRIEELESEVYGEEPIAALCPAWTVGMVNDSTGAVVDDAQKMRIISEKILASRDAVVSFSNTAKYKYQNYYYKPDGSFDHHDTSWQSASSFQIPKGWSVIIKVREQNYAVWNETSIAAFAETVRVEFATKKGAVKRLTALEEKAASNEAMAETVRENSNSILALKNTVNNMGTSEATLLLRYDDDFFPETEYGAISWETGLDGATSDMYIRSVGYKTIDSDDAVFVLNLPAKVAATFYEYTKNADGYDFIKSHEWLYHGGTFVPVQGHYYRVQYMSTSEADKLVIGAQRVILGGAMIQEIIDSVKTESSGGLLDEPLSAAETVEMEETSVSIAAASDPNAALIAFFTDLHLECNSDTPTTGTNITRSKKHITMYNKLCEKHDFDMLVFGGDYLQNSKQTPKTYAVAALQLLGTLIRGADSSAPIAVIKGNHDDNTMYTDYKNGYVDDAARWSAALSTDFKATRRNADFLEKGYGFYDIPNRKIRVFFLNSGDVPTALDAENNTIAWPAQNLTGFSGEQIQFVADNLKFSESGWQVLFFSHHPIKRNPFPAPMANVGVTTKNGGSVMEAVLQGFLAKERGSISNTTPDFEYSVSYDFTGNQSNTIIACINGHTHYDGYAYLDGINWIATRAIDGHATYGLKDTSTYIVVNRKERVISLIANGDGDDRAYVY